MKRLDYMILLVAAVMTASAEQARSDTLYVYRSWDAILTGEWDAVVIDPEIIIYSPYEYEFRGSSNYANEMLTDYAVAVSQGDSVWCINTEYLRAHYDGNVPGYGYAPMLFSDKIVMFEHIEEYVDTWDNGLDILEADTREPNLYMVDFAAGRVERVYYKTMGTILSRYHDLQMRYEAMKDRKKQRVVAYFLNLYINRLRDDDTAPLIGDR